MSDPPERDAPPWSGRPLPRLHVVTDDAMLARGGWETRALAVLEAGGAHLCLHLRGPRTDGVVLHALARGLHPHARRAGATLVVNDRVDVALAAGLDGVHLGERSLPVGVARELVGEGCRVGRSCHDAGQIASSRQEGADYAFLGTIFATPSHRGVPGMGLEGLAASLAGLGRFPVVAIGGIDPARVADVVGAGAYGVAVVRGVWSAREPAKAVLGYVEALGRAAGEIGE